MRVIQVGICLLLTFAVLAFGTVEEWSQAVLEVGAAALLVYWGIRVYRRGTQKVFVSPLLLPLMGFAAIVVAQIVLHTTASRYLTRVELQLLVTYIILVYLVGQAFQRTSDYRTFVWFLMSLAFFISLFGILHHLTYNGKLFWLRQARYGGIPFGPYVNRNHFAGFAELLIPLALVPLVLGKVRRERLFVVGLFSFVPIVGLLLSASRGGIVSLAIEIVILFALLLMRRVRTKNVLVGGVVVLCAVMMVSWVGVQEIFTRFSNPKTSDVAVGKRASMRQDTWKIFRDHPWIGTGLGTIQMVFPPYETNYDAKIVNHAHNDYLEALAETGILGGACCGWFLGVLVLSSLPGLASLQSFNSAINLAGLIGCCGMLVHSLVDFNLHIPANALLFFLSAHLATVRIQSESTASAVGERIRKRRRSVKQSITGLEQPV